MSVNCNRVWVLEATQLSQHLSCTRGEHDDFHNINELELYRRFPKI